MNLHFQYSIENIDWQQVVETLKSVGMGYRTPEVHLRAFANSEIVVFVFDDDKMIGFGRTISDGEYQAAIYDVAILPEYQGKGIGKMLIKSIIERLPNYNIILYASPGKEKFYEKDNFRRMKTGMARFAKADIMQNLGFTD